MNILFIHGYNSDSNSGTGQQVKAYFKNHNVIIPDFHLFDVFGTYKKIQDIVIQKKIDLIVGHSLGGFYTLACPVKCQKLVLNPCMYPSVEIPKLKPRPNHPEDSGEPPEETIKIWKEQEEKVYSSFDKKETGTVKGVFGKNDPLFGYKKRFDEIYGKDNSILTDGEHKFSDSQLHLALDCILHQ